VAETKTERDETAMLKDLPEDDFATACGECHDPHLPQADEVMGFRASMWAGIAADIRARRASQEMKGTVSC
jgi:hypothetical protein